MCACVCADTIHACVQAAQVMTHLRTVISEQQDSMVSAPVRLLRLLMRSDDSNVRKQMLRQKLVDVAALTVERDRAATAAAMARGDAPIAAPLPAPGPPVAAAGGAEAEGDPMATMSPQCVHIVVSAVEAWGGADVTSQQLEETIADVLSQVRRGTVPVAPSGRSLWPLPLAAPSGRSLWPGRSLRPCLTPCFLPGAIVCRCAAPAARRRHCRA